MWAKSYCLQGHVLRFGLSRALILEDLPALNSETSENYHGVLRAVHAT